MASGRKICISLDQSAVSKDAFAWAAKHVLRGEDQVYLISVVQPAIKTELAYGAGGRAPMIDFKDECTVDPAVHSSAKQFLDSCKQELEKEGLPAAQIKTEPLVACIGTANDVGHHIVDFATQQGCDSLIVGSRGMGETKRKMLNFLGLGSISDYVVKHAHCNVMVHKAHAPK